MGREPITAYDDDLPENEHVVNEEWETGAVRRAPRYGRILFLSVVAGLVAAAVHTAASTVVATTDDPFSSQLSGVVWIFGVLAVVWVAITLLLAATAIIVMDRLLSRRSRPVITEHSTVIVDDLVSPMTDEIPTWVRQADAERGDARDEPPERQPEG
ncbi:hypothetical protein ABZ477_09395 [Microbacterium sp. NPDC019599]|uniref:hypothetical protein n=1 Tax=Microbacterium sp. NPDC019599 TaxID=3154690 RepID=UPI003406E0F4